MRGIAEFTNISVDAAMVPKLSEMDDYLHLPVKKVSNPIKWWFDKCHVYPRLSHMALDYLSNPGMLFV